MAKDNERRRIYSLSPHLKYWWAWYPRDVIRRVDNVEDALKMLGRFESILNVVDSEVPEKPANSGHQNVFQREYISTIELIREVKGAGHRQENVPLIVVDYGSYVSEERSAEFLGAGADCHFLVSKRGEGKGERLKSLYGVMQALLPSNCTINYVPPRRKTLAQLL